MPVRECGQDKAAASSPGIGCRMINMFFPLFPEGRLRVPDAAVLRILLDSLATRSPSFPFLWSLVIMFGSTLITSAIVFSFSVFNP